MKTLVFVEQRHGKIKSSAFEALATAHKLAGGSQEVAALIIGHDVEALAKECAGWGADKVYVGDSANLKNYNPIAYRRALCAAVELYKPQLVLGIATPMGRDFFPRAAAKLDTGILTDVTTLAAEGDKIVATKPMYAGKCLAELSLENCPVKLVTLRPNVFAAAKPGNGAATVEKLAMPSDEAIPIQTLEIRKGKSERPDLTEATVIISGGRAMASADNFKILHECADVIGATVGASRAAVDSGYASHDMQVGQTGKTVNPNLYIACGISGSIQHMAGMRTSKVIVAVNTDADAPIFTIANYGIVGDLFKVVPILTRKLKELLQ